MLVISSNTFETMARVKTDLEKSEMLLIEDDYDFHYFYSSNGVLCWIILGLLSILP